MDCFITSAELLHKSDIMMIISNLYHFIILFGPLIVPSTSEYVNFQTPSAGNIQGNLVTECGKKYSVFLGIPYAQPPIGSLRFKPTSSLPPISQSTVVDASKNFSKQCIQTRMGPMGSDASTQSEDCLYLNVMSPKIDNRNDRLYPTMVWIHGGGFSVGSASQFPVSGILRNLVSRGVVVVTINYRLGIFGFFTTKTSLAPGNLGLYDQVSALQWVQNNIRNFGGDPQRVTVMGESAGSMSSSYLSMSPNTTGLFNQVIMMSGSALGRIEALYDEDPDDISANAMIILRCRTNASLPTANRQCPYGNYNPDWASSAILQQQQVEIACMQSKSVNEITALPPSAWRPRVDGLLVPESPPELIKKRRQLTYLMGTTKEETAVFDMMPAGPLSSGVVTSKNDYFSTDDKLISCKTFKCPRLVNMTSRTYYATSLTPTLSGWDESHFWFQQFGKIKSSILFWIPVFRDATEALNSNSTVYLYSWDWKNADVRFNQQKNFYWNGASHASELQFLFDMVRPGMPFDPRRDTSQDSIPIETLGKLWTNFAKYGNPTPDSSVNGIKWTPFDKQELKYLSIDVPRSQMKTNFHGEDVAYWDGIVATMEYAVQNCT